MSIRNVGPVTVMAIGGDLTAASEPSLKEAYERINGEGATKILLSFEESAYINSGGIAVLIQMLAKATKSKQAVAICGVSEHFRKIFRMVGITKFATVYDTEQAALQSMSQGG
jgi:anti-anti-sigma factor